MERENGFIPIDSVEFEGSKQVVRFVETMNVKDGVVCDVYEFPNDPTKDLGMIKIRRGQSTPFQKVLEGDKTIEGHISGKGLLIIEASDGNTQVYSFDDNMDEKMSVDVKIGQLMQWQAAPDSDLTVFEICFPPYQDGRFENVERC